MMAIETLFRPVSRVCQTFNIRANGQTFIVCTGLASEIFQLLSNRRQIHGGRILENAGMDMDLPFYVISVTKGREHKGKFLAAFAEKPLAEEYARYLCSADDSGRREYLAV